MVLAMLCAVLSWLGGDGAQAQQEQPVVAVMVSEAKQIDVTPSFRQVGRVNAVDRVEIRARVSGVLEARRFEEGRLVEKGQVLYAIEREPYEVVVAQYQAELASADASLAKADADLARAKELRRRGTLAAADLDTAEADRAVANANLLRARAALARAELDLGYTEIKSPIAGRISISNFSVGNLITPESGTLATITSVNPVYVDIAVSAKRILAARKSGIDIENPTVVPFLTLADGSDYAEPGKFVYLSPEVDRETDTMTGRARFENGAGLLVPGDFVTVAVRAKEPVHAIVVPQAAVQRDKQGYFVLIADPADKVEKRRVKTGDTVDSSWRIDEGLTEGERVIVQGVQKVRPGLSVTARPIGESEGQ